MYFHWLCICCAAIWRSLIINILCNSLFCTARKRVNDRPETVQWKYCRMHGRSIWLCIYCYRRWVEMSDEIAELIDSCRCVIVVLQVMTWYSVGVTSPTRCNAASTTATATACLCLRTVAFALWDCSDSVAYTYWKRKKIANIYKHQFVMHTRLVIKQKLSGRQLLSRWWTIN